MSSSWLRWHVFAGHKVSNRSKTHIFIFDRIVVNPLTRLTLSLKNIRIVSSNLTPLASLRFWVWINITIAVIYVLIVRTWPNPLRIICLNFIEKVKFSLFILVYLVAKFKNLFKVALIGYVYWVSKSKLFWVFQLFRFPIALSQRLRMVTLCYCYTVDTVASTYLAKLDTIFIY